MFKCASMERAAGSQIHFGLHLIVVAQEEFASFLQYKPADEKKHHFQMHCTKVCIGETILGAVKFARNQSRIY